MASSSQTGRVVVWEWEERPGLWIPYEVNTVRFLERSYSKFKQRVSRNSTVNLGESDPNLNYYEVDLVNLEQLNVRSGKRPCILHLIVKFHWFIKLIKYF